MKDGKEKFSLPHFLGCQLFISFSRTDGLALFDKFIEKDMKYAYKQVNFGRRPSPLQTFKSPTKKKARFRVYWRVINIFFGKKNKKNLFGNGADLFERNACETILGSDS